ncbi:hypothetical protein FE392_08695, partial [Xenorhabdus sp. 12]
MMNSIKKWLSKNPENKTSTNVNVNRLSTVCDPSLDENIGILDKNQIKSEDFIGLINDKKCEIRFGKSNFHEIVLFSSLIGFLLGFCFFIDSVVNTWKVNEKAHLRIISYAKRDYGEEFYLNPSLPDYLKNYKYLSDAESISWPQYFHIRYTDSGFYSKSRVRKNLFLDGGFFLFFVTMILIHLWVVYLLRKIPSLVIDRERKLFYTWRRGKMYVARYSQVEVVNAYNTLYLRLYGLDKNNKLSIYTFVPRIPNLLDDVISKSYLLDFIAKYLIKGKESVSSVDF